MREEFRDIPGFEGRYQISNHGRVLSLNYQNTGKPKVLTPVKHHLGYLLVHLGQSKIRMVHSLVAEVFIPNPSHRRYVNHIDGNKQNNIVSNLEWVTPQENNRHAIRTGLRNPKKNGAVHGRANPTSKPVLQFSRDGVFIKEWPCISEAARFYKMNPCQIINNMARRTRTAHGSVWRKPE